nr:MAG TPA: nucelotide kinase [Bacteriophage sp.]
MIESMKIRKGLVFTLPIEPNQVIGAASSVIKMYIYKIGEGQYALINMYPLRLKVVNVDKSIVECNIIEDEYNEPYRENIPIQFEVIAKNGTIVSEEKAEMVNHPDHYAWLKKLCDIEPIDICRHLDFNCGSAVKYLLRKGKKEMNLSEREQRIQDLSKAIFYLQDEIDMMKKGK